MSRFAFALVALSSSVLSSCSLLEEHGCTEIGCNDQVTASFTKLLAAHADAVPLTIEACLDQQCVSATVTIPPPNTPSANCNVSGQGTACCNFDPPVLGAQCLVSAGGTVTITFPLSNASSASLTLTGTVRDADGKELLSDEKAVTLSAFQPNGPDCDPTCHQGQADFATP